MVKLSYALPALGFIGAANAHTRVWGLWVNDVFQGDGRGTYVRSPPSDSPVKDVTLKDIVCGVNNVQVPSSVNVAAGDKVTFEWYHANRADDIIASTHKGPITVYIAEQSTNGAGGVWTKLWESGLTAGTWATDTLIKNGGKHDMTLPSGLKAGDYLLRAEIIGLHEGDTNYNSNRDRGAQFYPSCSQVKVSGGGSLTPPGTFNFLGGYTATDPGILFDLYNGATSYPIPGPAVWDGKSGGSSNNNPAPATTPTTAPTTTPTKNPVPTSTNTPAATNPPANPVTTPKSTPTGNNNPYYPPGTTPAASPKPTSTTPPGSCQLEDDAGVVQKYHQCGGKNHTGPTTCVEGTYCKVQNDFYSQCVEPGV